LPHILFSLQGIRNLLSTTFICVSLDVGLIVQTSRHTVNEINVMGSAVCDLPPPRL